MRCTSLGVLRGQTEDLPAVSAGACVLCAQIAVPLIRVEREQDGETEVVWWDAAGVLPRAAGQQEKRKRQT